MASFDFPASFLSYCICLPKHHTSLKCRFLSKKGLVMNCYSKTKQKKQVPLTSADHDFYLDVGAIIFDFFLILGFKRYNCLFKILTILICFCDSKTCVIFVVDEF